MSRADRWAAGLAVALVAVAAVVAYGWYLAGAPVRASAAPLFARWDPHLGPGTPLALAVAFLVVRYGPALARTLSWRRLLLAGYAAAVAWTLSLALVDGWRRGVAGRLTTGHEYLSEVAGVTDPAGMLRGFTGRILDGPPDAWTTHVAGHPPGALLVFVGLDRAGLSGGGWAAALCVLVGALVTVAVPVTVRAVGRQEAGRAAVPFLVLFPGAVWLGVSADGLFAGVTAGGIALLALGLTGRRRRRVFPAVAGGLLLGIGCYLSYGLVLLAVVVAAVVGLAAVRAGGRRAGLLVPLGGAAFGVVVVVVAFAVAGFWWLDGYDLVVRRYYQGIASSRPYHYWVWANLAALAVAAGPAMAAVLRRAAVGARAAFDGRATGAAYATVAAWVLPLAAAGAILLADLSGLSKAEVERIWLPFAVWLPAGAALLPRGDRRTWLAVQAAVALLVDHLLRTPW